MIDPVHSLAFSMQANPGVYALLLGSGISRAAQIPTGWEIMLDLIRKLATLEKEKCKPDPEDWYLSKYKKQAKYSDLLNRLAKTPAERQQLLRSYWEPSEQEREDDLKQPTSAHRAIAKLVANGFVKVIITTNFDRLMELALADEGVQPTIVSTSDQMHGALPLPHTKCYLFKIHGDYLDTRILNTPNELKKYPEEFNQFLDRVFDEFGLIICGWSAEWDTALRKAIKRAPSRRFTTYWALRRNAGDEARRLIKHRAAQEIPIKDADTFFTKVQEHVQSLLEFSRPHPLSTEAAVASLKRYLAEDRYRIQHYDLIKETVDRILEITSSESFAIPSNERPETKSATVRVRAYEGACSTLLAMAPISGFWAEENHAGIWRASLQRLSQAPIKNGSTFCIALQRYPGTLLLYALGMGALEGNRLQFLGRILTTEIGREYQGVVLAVQKLPPFCFFSQHPHEARILEGMEKRYAPLNDWLHQSLRQHMKNIIPDDNKYTRIFDTLEILMALAFTYTYRNTDTASRPAFPPPGAFGYRYGFQENPILAEITESISEQGDDSPFVTCGIFGQTADDCIGGIETLKAFILRLNWI